MCAQVWGGSWRGRNGLPLLRLVLNRGLDPGTLRSLPKLKSDAYRQNQPSAPDSAFLIYCQMMAMALVYEAHIEFCGWGAKMCTFWSPLLRDLSCSQG